MSEASASRRQRLSADVRREQLMAAAIETLALRGFHATTSEEIARRAGISKGLLWHYFADLDELFEMTARHTLNELAAVAAATIDFQRPAAEVIRSAVHAAAALHSTHGVERRAMREIVQNLRRPDGEPRFTQADLNDLYTAQESLFRRGQDEGSFRDSLDPRLLAVTYEGAVEAMLGYLDAYPHTDANKHAETVADVLLNGITQNSTPPAKTSR